MGTDDVGVALGEGGRADGEWGDDGEGDEASEADGTAVPHAAVSSVTAMGSAISSKTGERRTEPPADPSAAP